ncbi:MAG TPA: hypothetical protein VMS54_02280, partial [Vicinamibacterales bacterium]|nr:hypothetical protein [Vicinamibacterales bacterium]
MAPLNRREFVGRKMAIVSGVAGRSGHSSAARRLAPAVGVSFVVLVSAPAIGQIRGAIQAAFPSQYRLILGAFVVAAIVAGVLYAVATVREGRVLRFAL